MNTSLGEGAVHFQLDQSCSAVLTSLLYSMGFSESRNNDEEAAQAVYLGLCHVSSVRTLAGEIKTPKAESRCKNYKNQERDRCGSKGLAHPEKDAYALQLDSETMQHFCNTCNIALKSKDDRKIVKRIMVWIVALNVFIVVVA